MPPTQTDRIEKQVRRKAGMGRCPSFVNARCAYPGLDM
jgi:hypothetical protein